MAEEAVELTQEFDGHGAGQRTSAESRPMQAGVHAGGDASVVSKAPSGKPAASGLATVTMSGVMP